MRRKTLSPTPYSTVKVGDLVQVVNGYLPSYGLHGNVVRLGDAGGIELVTVRFPMYLTYLTFTRADLELLRDLDATTSTMST